MTFLFPEIFLVGSSEMWRCGDVGAVPDVALWPLSQLAVFLLILLISRLY